MAAAEVAVHADDPATALGRTAADLDPEGADAYQRIAAFAGRAM